MMNHFCEVGTIWQVILLVISLITVIILTGCCVLSFRHRCNIRKQFGLSSVLLLLLLLLLCAALFVTMQVDSRITSANHVLHLPYLLVFAVMLASLGIGVRSFQRETKNRKTINNTSIKESFDNLPAGVCFFNEMGLPVLCNREMHRFSFAVSGKDVQFITDLSDLLAEDFMPIEGVTKSGKIFTLPGGRAWQMEKRTVADEKGGIYALFIVSDVTELEKSRAELLEENAQLCRVQAQLRQLSSNLVAVTREEEILNTKMRVHDEMGRCLVEARKHLRDSDDIPESVMHSWRRAVSMLRYNNETNDDDMLSQIRQTCEAVGLAFRQTGTRTKDDAVAYILTCAVRECVTNAVRYADASELCAAFSEDEVSAAVTVTNNGKAPEREIVEGGGLSTLRRRVERAGGTMTVQSLPIFKLTVTVPKEKEGVL